MTFSIGQNFFNDLLKSSDKRTHNDQKAISQTYHLQERLNYFWKNNDKPVLLQSQKYSGMSDLAGKSEPLGGHINWHQCGITNAPGSCTNGCPDEYPFWGTIKNIPNKNPGIVIGSKETTQQSPKQKLNKKVDFKENFTVFDNREDFSSNTTIWTIVIIVSIITILIVILTVISHYSTKQ